MKAFLIDPAAREVREVEYSGDYREIYKHIEADTFDAAVFNDSGDAVFVDDNGLLKPDPGPFFAITGYPQPLAGRGLVLGLDADGESVSPSEGIDRVRGRVRFL